MGIKGKVLLIVTFAIGTFSAEAVLFKSTADPNYNTDAPTGTLAASGWQYEGNWINFLGTPIAPMFFVAAKHIGGSVGDTFVLNGFTYHTVAVTDSPNSDLRVWQVAETFPSYAPLYTGFNESGKDCVVIGRGTERGAPVIVGGVTNGWQWGDNTHVERWGENTIAGFVNGGPGFGSLIEVTFDRSAGSNECALSYGDSSGAIFIQDSGTWKLAGIHYAVDGPYSNAVDGTSFNATLLDRGGLYESSGGSWVFVSNTGADKPSSFYSTRISSNAAWIASVTNIAPVAPVAAFTASPTSGGAPLTVTFTDTSTGTLSNRFWIFGDGSTTNTTANILTHTYNAVATNTVTLIARGTAGSSTNTQTGLIVVNGPSLSVAPGSLNFGSLTIGQTATLTFSAANTGDMLLTGTVSVAGSFAVTVNSLNLNPGQTQTVAVTFTPSSAGVAGSSVIFRTNGGDSTNAVTGTGLTPASVSAPASLNFGYVATGNFTQTTVVVTNTGGTATSNGVATANAPFSIFSGTPFNVPGNASANIVVRFSPSAAGNFNDTVTITTANGGNANVSVSGIGATVPVASFTSATNTTTSLPVSFTDTSTGTITNRLWDFGDGGTSSSQNPMHTFVNAGTYTVTLTVTGPVGADTATGHVSVRDDLAPSVPGNLSASVTSPTQIKLTWSAANDTGGSGVASYLVSRDDVEIGSTGSLSFTDTGLPSGSNFCYQVAAYDHAGNTSSWSAATCAATPVDVSSLAGTYYGLITNGPVFEQTGFVKITLKSTGELKGSGTLGAQKIKFAGAFSQDGIWTGAVGALTFNLVLELTNHTDQIRGTVSDGAFTSQLLANRVNPVSPALVGNYTVVLGTGNGTVVVDSKGNLRFSGVLPDNSRAKQKVPVSKHGTWPLYALKGQLAGWVTFTNIVGVSDCDGTLEWFSNASQLDLVGSKYVPPAFPVGDALLILGSETNSVTVDAAEKVAVVSGDSVNLSVSINSKTGQFSGRFGQPAVKFNGVVLQIQNLGFGFFPGGYVLFEPVAP